MMKLIYEKSSFYKIEIIRLVVESGGKMTKNRIIKDLSISNATANKYLHELSNELSDNALIITDNIIIFNVKKCSLYDVQKYYFSQGVVKDVLTYCFFYSNVTFERLAGELYISHSKLFNILKFMDKELKHIGVSIRRRPYIKLEGSFESIMVIYNLYLQTENSPFDKSFSKLNIANLRNTVIHFLDSYDFKIEHFVVEELCLWLLTVSDRFYLEKICFTEKKLAYDKFINLKSPLLNRIKEYFSPLSEKYFDRNGCLLILIFLIFNMTSIHFANAEEEKKFFTNELIEDYQYQSFILSILMKEPYNISSNSLEVLSVKIEGSIHFSSLIYPYYYFSRSILTPKLNRSDYLKKIKEALKKDFKDLFNTNDLQKEWIYELLAYVALSFQKSYVENTNINIGVYSIRGGIFESQYCREIKKAINIVPYYDLRGQKADILIVDDIELLNNTTSYEKYLIVGDARYKNDKEKFLLFP
ncbi:helix-turn-helix domain-containing protein [Enterococcus hirae]|uniref:helix-turn-helix domain-containing protein n=1 Tax=Enterococcus hirae TaxID=1354 RepID=UPI0015C92ED5|nr:helix-turn-helix domain-containing protein [Enterococcus hirae]